MVLGNLSACGSMRQAAAVQWEMATFIYHVRHIYKGQTNKHCYGH